MTPESRSARQRVSCIMLVSLAVAGLYTVSMTGSRGERLFFLLSHILTLQIHAIRLSRMCEIENSDDNTFLHNPKLYYLRQFLQSDTN